MCPVPTAVEVNLWLDAWQVKWSPPVTQLIRDQGKIISNLKARALDYPVSKLSSSAAFFHQRPPPSFHEQRGSGTSTQPALQTQETLRKGTAWHLCTILRNATFPAFPQLVVQWGNSKGTATRCVEGEAQGAVRECNKGKFLVRVMCKTGLYQ